MGTARPKFALDTNVLIDLGEGKSFANRFLGSYRSSGLVLPPTVVVELVWMIDNNHRAKAAALVALQNLRRWEIQPFDTLAVGKDIVEINTDKLMMAGLLPEGERNDGRILIETALHLTPSLVTSDNHLLSINPGQLVAKLDEFDLSPVSIVHPKDLLH